jgi:superfamily II DNA or RNA helicase
MSVVLRDYQVAAIDQVRDAFRRGTKRVCLVAPTGAGKTTIAAEMIRLTVERGGRVLFLAHRKELIDQCAERLDQFGIDLGVIKAGTIRAKRSAAVQVASVQTLVNRELPPATLIIPDECHRSIGPTQFKIISSYPDARVVGLTATPVRLDGRGLGEMYQELVVAARVSELVQRGVLIRPRVYAPVKPDLAGVASTAGDYNQAALGAAMDKPKLVGDIVEHWLRLAHGRKTVVFASSVEHSMHISEAFRNVGIAAQHLDGATETTRRVQILKDLSEGALTVVSNVNVLSEGWDCPSVECIVLARPTQSMGMYLQMVGRGVRSAPGKREAIVLDHAGCTLSHGLATDDRAWSLTSPKRRPSEAMPLKNCPACYIVVPSGTAVCQCGYAWERVAGQGHRLVEVVAGELVEYGLQLCPDCRSTCEVGVETCACGFAFRRPHWLDRFRPAGSKPTPAEKQRLYEFLEGVAARKGWNPGAVAHQYRAVMGVWPRGMRDEA